MTETEVNPLELAFLKELDLPFSRKASLRVQYANQIGVSTLLNFLRASGVDEALIERGLNNLGSPTDPMDASASDDPLHIAQGQASRLPPYTPPREAQRVMPTDAPAPTSSSRPSTVAQALLKLGVQLTDEELTERNIELRLLKENRISDEQLARAYADKAGLEFVDLSYQHPDPHLKNLISEHLISSTRVIPLRQNPDGRYVFALANPKTLFVASRIEDQIDQDPIFAVCPASQIEAYIASMYDREHTFSSLRKESQQREESVDVDDDLNVEETTVSQTLTTILRDAINMRGSDIHLQATNGDTRVRIRVDGILHDYHAIPKNMHRAVLNHLRVRCKISSTSENKPQDASLTLDLGQKFVSMRVNIIPAAYGAKATIRVLPSPEEVKRLDSMHISPKNLELIQWALEQSTGIITISGPTGSGKTGSLYSMATHLDSPGISIFTIENPIEIRKPQFIQIELNPDVKNEEFKFVGEEALRAVLRQDPDVIIVGEMRDADTVRLAIQAAQTGHLVLSTTHSNSAAGTVSRLKERGADAFDLATTLRLMIAQRLVGRPCPRCSVQEPPTPEMFERIGGEVPEYILLSTGILEDGTECKKCNGSGIYGRIAIQEMLPVTAELREAVRANKSEEELEVLARKYGFRTLYEDGLDKVRQHLTTPQALNSVVSRKENL